MERSNFASSLDQYYAGGLGHHPAVVYAIADGLAQPEGGWQKFDRRGWRPGVSRLAARLGRIFVWLESAGRSMPGEPRARFRSGGTAVADPDIAEQHAGQPE
jgi:hypothetical protein